ncbi:hypothetical protein BOX15_Mlig027759g8, partial [Macrostomum lignano]
WHQVIEDIRDFIYHDTQFDVPKFNSVLVNFYTEPGDRIPWHSDDEDELGDRPTIATVSFGAERLFMLRRRDGNVTHRFPTLPGSLILMAGNCQKRLQHQVPAAHSQNGVRISLTFRVTKPELRRKRALPDDPTYSQPLNGGPFGDDQGGRDDDQGGHDDDQGGRGDDRPQERQATATRDREGDRGRRGRGGHQRGRRGGRGAASGAAAASAASWPAGAAAASATSAQAAAAARPYAQVAARPAPPRRPQAAIPPIVFEVHRDAANKLMQFVAWLQTNFAGEARAVNTAPMANQPAYLVFPASERDYNVFLGGALREEKLLEHPVKRRPARARPLDNRTGPDRVQQQPVRTFVATEVPLAFSEADFATLLRARSSWTLSASTESEPERLGRQPSSCASSQSRR